MAVPLRAVFLLFLLPSLLSLCSLPKLCNATDYLKLPLHHKNPFTTPTPTLVADRNRIFTAFETQKTVKSPVVSGASIGSGQYFVDFLVGTPPQKILLVADTGSDLVWVKCAACRNCSRHRPGTAFFPRHSKTFSLFHCYERECRLVPPPPKPNHCNQTRLHSTCRFEYEYTDTTKTAGFFSRELVTLNASSGRQVKLKNLAFGCGFHVSGPSVSGSSFNGAHGVMGLGRGPISFSSQLGKRFGNKFSYCLMDYTISPPPTSYLLIGKAPEPLHKKPMSFTPLQTNRLSPTFYYIRIENVTVEGVALPINPSIWAVDQAGNGGTVIDSGTTLSFLPRPAYRQILAAFRRRIKLPKVVDPVFRFDLCVNVSDVANPRLPRLGFGLLAGAVFSPPTRNYFVDAADGVKCLALQPVNSPSAFSVIGNLMQQGFLFEFDRDESRLGFSQTGCAIS